jgi:hypothetical protein
MVKDINPGPNDGYPNELISVAGHLFFQATDGTSGRGLWSSDGQTARTIQIWHTDGWLNSLTSVNGQLFFCVKHRNDDASHNCSFANLR